MSHYHKNPSLEHFNTPKGNSVVINTQISIPLRAPNLRKLLNTLFCLYRCLSWAFYADKIMFFGGLSSFSYNVCKILPRCYICIIFLLLSKNIPPYRYITFHLSTCQLMNIWAVSTLGYYMNTVVNVCTQVVVLMHVSISLIYTSKTRISESYFNYV